MTRSGVLLEAHGIRKSFGGVPALVDGRLELRAGEIHALVGENGAGKSTLMRILAGAVPRDGGTLQLDGRPFAPRHPRAALDAGVHLVHQELMLVDELSVAENLHLGAEPARKGWLDRRAMDAATVRVLERLAVDRRPRERLGELSLGERQLVEVGRALLHDLRVLAMDEPTATLTDVESARLFDVVRELRDRGVAVVWISHRLEEIARLCDRVTTMRDGAWVATARVADYSAERIVRDMVGRPIGADAGRAAATTAGPVALELNGLGHDGRYDGVDLALHRGEILGVFGLVGSGRSELARGIVGAPPPQRGRVLLDGRPFRPRGPRDALRAGVVLLTEDRKADGLVLGRSVLENVTLAALPRFAPHGLLDLRAERAFVEQVRVDLALRTANVDLEVAALSGGNQQKVLIARALATDARVWLVDEPTRGVDVGSKAEIHALLRRLAAGGRSILMISSDLPELLAVADRLVVVREGRVAGVLGRADFSPEAVMARATGARTSEVHG